MEKRHGLIFDKVIINQFKKSAKNKNIKSILSKMLNKIEILGSLAGKLIDSKLSLYEIKNKRPPIRLYFKQEGNDIHIFEFEIKTSRRRQQKTINKLKSKIFSGKSFLFNIFFKFQKSLIHFCFS